MSSSGLHNRRERESIMTVTATVVACSGEREPRGFDCSGCGACCRMVGALPAMHEYDRGDGACKHLTDSNTCAIYESRPSLCRVDLMKPSALTDAYWHELNHEACERLHLRVYGQTLTR
jgi:Fe-S-cluster containining protein